MSTNKTYDPDLPCFRADV